MGNQSPTPGPWRVEWIRNSVYIKADDTDRDISICRVMTHRNSNNTSLLVNAPDLLAALESIVLAEKVAELELAYDRAEALILKIKGKNDA
jgi:hypothetical protein